MNHFFPNFSHLLPQFFLQPDVQIITPDMLNIFHKHWHLGWRTGIFLATVLWIWCSHTALMHLPVNLCAVCRDYGKDSHLFINIKPLVRTVRTSHVRLLNGLVDILRNNHLCSVASKQRGCAFCRRWIWVRKFQDKLEGGSVLISGEITFFFNRFISFIKVQILLQSRLFIKELSFARIWGVSVALGRNLFYCCVGEMNWSSNYGKRKKKHHMERDQSSSSFNNFTRFSLMFYKNDWYLRWNKLLEQRVNAWHRRWKDTHISTVNSFWNYNIHSRTFRPTYVCKQSENLKHYKTLYKMPDNIFHGAKSHENPL